MNFSAEKDAGQEEPSHEKSRNSFSVPEEDDDEGVVEAVPETAPIKARVFSPIHFTIPSSEAAESEDESDDGEQDPKSTPPTSHSGEGKASVAQKSEKESEKDSEPKPSVADSNKRDVRPSSAAPVPIEVARPSQLSAIYVEPCRASGFGSRESPIEIDNGGRVITPIDRWIEEQEKDSDSIRGNVAISEKNVAASVKESAETEKAGERRWRTFDEPKSQPEKQPSKEPSAEEDDAIPSTPESFSGSSEQPAIDTDSADESDDGSVNRDITSSQIYQAKSSSRQEAIPEAEAFNKGSGYGLSDWQSPMFGTSDGHPRVPSPSDKALAKPLESEYADRNSSFASSWGGIQHPTLLPRATSYIPATKEQPNYDHLTLGKSFDPMSRPYFDGPFQRFREPEMEAPSLPDFTHRKEAPQVKTSVERTIPATHEFDYQPWHRLGPQFHFNPCDNRKDTLRPQSYESTKQVYNWRAGPGGATAAQDPVSRVSISDIVAESDREFNVRNLGKRLKRKASEMEKGPEYTVPENGAKEATAGGNGADESSRLTDSIPDAQPQDVIPQDGYETSQLTELSTTKAAKQDTQTLDEQPPRKRMKMTTEATNASRPKSNFTKYAATALAGAVVGGVGTLAALVALPQEFFS